MKIKDIKKLILQTLKEVIDTNKPKTIEEKRRKHAKNLHAYLVKQKRNHKTLSEILEGPRTKFHPLLIKWQKLNLKNAILNEQISQGELDNRDTANRTNLDLSDTYSGVLDTTPDEFADLAMDTQVQMDGECPCYPDNCPDYGELTIYESGNCDHSITINDGFICCSSNNPYYGDMDENIEFQGGNGGTQLMESGTSYCYHPDEGATGGDPTGGSTYPTFPEGYQFTFDDLNTAAVHMWGMPNGLECDLPLFGNGPCTNVTWVPGDGTVPDNYEGDYSGNAGCSVFGCAHPGATNYDSSAAGCQDPETSGVMTPGGEPSGTTPWYHCCTFQGCGASGTQPPANNVTTITSDVFDPIIGDESQSWWVDDNSCTFEYPCLNSYVIITLPDGTATEFPTQMVDYTDENGNEWDFEMPNAGIITSNYEDETFISNYDGIPALQVGDEGCVVEACANPNLLGVVDGLGNALTTTYAIAEGDYTTYTVENNPDMCEVEACGPGDGDVNNSEFDNYIDEFTFNPDGLDELSYIINNQQDLCENEEVEPEVVNWNPDCSNLETYLSFNYSGETATLGNTTFDLSIIGDAETEDADAYGWCGYAQAVAKLPFLSPWFSEVIGTTDDTIATNQSIWQNCCPQNVTIYGCTNPLDNSGAYNELNEEDTSPSSCYFEYCMFDPTSVSVIYNYPTNWVCFEYPELCVLTGTTDPCNVDLATLQADPGLCDEYTDSNFGNWIPGTCEYVAIGCMDSGGEQTWGDIGPFTTGVGTGANGAALNYSAEYEMICDGTFGDECTEGPDGITQQSTDPTAEGYNPFGCCCTYYPTCTDEEAYNYVPVTNAQDDGSCVDVLEGCMNPAFPNYNPDANVDDGSCLYENACFDQGGVSGVGESTPSMWGNYICLNDTVIDTDDGPSTIGAELCNCGPGFCTGNEIDDCNSTDCSAFSTLDTTLGTFIDGNVYDSTTGLMDYAVDNPGSCDGLDAPSCLADWDGDGNGSELYYYQNSSLNDGETTAVEILNWNPYATTDDGSCEIFGCEDPNALNYFCNIEGNEDMCDGGVIMDSVVGAAGITVHADFPCEYEANYDCNTWYNTDEGEKYGCGVNVLGEGTYSNLIECEQNCYSCTYVWARLCNGTEEAEFECLQIDGKSGESNTSQPNLYFTEGDFFTIDSDASQANVTYINNQTTSQLLPGGDPRKNVWEVIELSNTVVENVPYDLATAAECIDIVYGCMDDTALNYNPDANVDDGSCEYPSECFDITAIPCNMDKLRQCYERAQYLISAGLTYLNIPDELEQFLGMQVGYGNQPGERSWNCTDQQMGDYFFFSGFDCEIEEGVEFDCTGDDDDGGSGFDWDGHWICGIDYFNNNGDQQPLLSDIRAGLTVGTFGSAAYPTTAEQHFYGPYGMQEYRSCCRPVTLMDQALGNYSWIYDSQEACNNSSACACNVEWGQNDYCNGNMAYDAGTEILGTVDPWNDPEVSNQYWDCNGNVVSGWAWGDLDYIQNSLYESKIDSSPANLLEQKQGSSRRMDVVGGPSGPSAIDDIGGGRDFPGPFDPSDPTNPCNCDPLPTQIDGDGDGVNERWCSYPSVSFTSETIPWQVTSAVENTTTGEITVLPSADNCLDTYSSGGTDDDGGNVYVDRDPANYATCGTRNNWCGTGNKKEGMRLNKLKLNKNAIKENKLRSFIRKTLNNLNK